MLKKNDREKLYLACLMLFLIKFLSEALIIVPAIYGMTVFEKVLGANNVNTLISITALVGFLYVIAFFANFLSKKIEDHIYNKRYHYYTDIIVNGIFKAQIRNINTEHFTRKDIDTLSNIDSKLIEYLYVQPVLFLLLFGFVFYLSTVIAIIVFLFSIIIVAINVYCNFQKKELENKKKETTQNKTLWFNYVETISNNDNSLNRDNVLNKISDINSLDLSSRNQKSYWENLSQSFNKSSALFLQSSALGLGAYLVLGDMMSLGAIFACSIIGSKIGTILPKVLQGITYWRIFHAKINQYEKLSQENKIAFENVLVDTDGCYLSVQSLAHRPKNSSQFLLKNISFNIHAGELLMVMGGAGSGKSTLARYLSRSVLSQFGEIYLNNKSYNQFSHETFGKMIGYFPQDYLPAPVSLLDNISNFERTEEALDKVLNLLTELELESYINSLPSGLQSVYEPEERNWSASLIAMSGFLRSVYNKPKLIVIDSIDNNLDDELKNIVFKQLYKMKLQKHIIIILTQNKISIEYADQVLILKSGEIIKSLNHNDIQKIIASNQHDE